MSENTPTVSVIIPARDSASVLPGALRSITGQDYGNIVEVVVAAADNASAEAAAAVTVVSNPSQTTPAGLNLALAATSGEIIVRCDAQSVLPPGYVDRAVETLMRTGAACVGGMQVPVGVTKWETAIAAAMRSGFGAGDARYRRGGEEGPVETVYLGVFERRAIEELGGYDEDFSRTQDYELNHRINESGRTVWFDPYLKVEYRPRPSIGGLWRQYFDYGRAKRQFRRKHPGALRWRQLAAPLLVASLVISLVVSAWLPIALIVPAGYALSLIVVGMTIGSFRTSLALGAMHLAWGCGFLSAPSTR